MTPALQDGDRFIGWPVRETRLPRRGSVVAFRHPHRSEFWLTKRVVGLGGELISIQMGEVLIDGQSGLDPWGRGWSAPDGEWAIPPQELFVLSDQRPLTRDDSRTFGPVGASSLYRQVFPARSHKPPGQVPLNA